MWDLVKVNSVEPSKVSSYLAEGYEPFAVSMNLVGNEIIWMKKEVIDERIVAANIAIWEEVNSAVHSEQVEPDKGASTGATPRAKGKTSS